MKIIPLSEGTFTVGKDKKFVPFDTEKDDLQNRSQGSLLVEIQPFVVITSSDIILLDTGLGFTNADGVLQIHQNLIDHNINPMDVTKVVLSHLHKDHSGGIAREDKMLNQQFISFPNAVYYVSRNEFDFALKTGRPSFTPDEFRILTDTDRVRFTGDSGNIDGYIHYELTGAHSPYHQSITIKEDGETVFFGGDVAPQLSQMRSRFVAKYDYDGQLCMELRQQWRERGQKEGWTFLFYHDIKTPVYRF
ncbi:MAG: MBL fold metallo-hydrolase [Dinghuibacter sp.]|nr:MBL fold metallo-hydrolase [Dinghuibacter sp.]